MCKKASVMSVKFSPIDTGDTVKVEQPTRSVIRMLRGVIYARYSSDNQREESIEGQIRENKVYAERNDIEIVNTYIDRAYSAKPLSAQLFSKW